MRLLPPDALAGTRVGLSVSESPDLARLGLLEAHFRLTLAEITRTVVVAGGDLVYGGRVDDAGYTPVVVGELQRYARRDRPLLVCLARHEHRGLPLAAIGRFREQLGLLGRLVCLDADGHEIAAETDRGPAPVTEADPAARARALSGLRRHMTRVQHGRVFVGGRRSGYEGPAPGLMEEALLALAAGQPVYLAAGFGGVTMDIARELGVDGGDWLPPVAAAGEPGWAESCRQLRAVAAAAGWRGLRNGLTEPENRWLASTHRPGEIAALVGLGLGRLNAGGDGSAA